MNNFIIVINEQHKLLESQKLAIESAFGKIRDENFLKVPAQGWSLQEMNSILKDWLNRNQKIIIFVSPVPYLLRGATIQGKLVFIFHNDRREKTELPDGRVIYKVADTGWQLV